MAPQKTVDLNKPLDAAEEAVIRRVPLEPELATVALTLHGDIYRQAQGKTNHAIVWHPLTQAYICIVFLVSTAYVFKDLVEVLDSMREFFDLLMHNKYVLTRYFPAMIFVAGTVGLISFTITDEFRVISDKMASDKYMAQVFRFPLRIYANAQPTEQNSAFVKSASQSTDFIEYRNSPIAVVTVVPLPNQSTSDTFFAKITGLHVRKSYRSAGAESDLLEYAKEKARLLCSRYVADNKIHTKNMRIVLVAEAYSVDQNLTSLYQKLGFSVKNKTTKLDPYSAEATKHFFYVIPAGALLNFFGVFRVTYELQLDNVVDLVAESSAAKKNKNKLRKRT
ncbi:hypothetical protein METBIDRAFT_42053 [Metschnikowia bicuspidata var. bicuspidata NRRL YB-4993]|uniref:N-acetyltransferase domain-containing protein n=1 Tax=Metschnikowia bicuspidata var. bicuspidata NRRL YB-4993 TaxID=869754 RepID=A0A1A0HBW1_9ASCO|nr:hypothetical protein METBIDRAFT_42053 [Metschnikowia bicuspidata var. bicuspidata NRRL YB-4993]OBA21470.1 hypothetical protein METBIDRAFT_42053 [Metschnikowia bicuspidata var. bicuspidata NRRL YB-4993]